MAISGHVVRRFILAHFRQHQPGSRQWEEPEFGHVTSLATLPHARVTAPNTGSNANVKVMFHLAPETVKTENTQKYKTKIKSQITPGVICV